MMDLFNAISLRNPWWLLLALQPLVLWLLAYLRRRLQQDEFADTMLLPWVLSQRKAVSRHSLRQVSLVLAWGVLAVAMAGPRVMQRVIDSGEAQYTTLQIVVDLSYSMSARDLTPTRLERVKLELNDLLERVHQLRMGIIVYAARPHVMLPPTADKSVLRHAIELLRVRQLPTEGSDLVKALTMARQQFDPASNQARAILLISDGELKQDTVAQQEQLTALLAGLRQDNIHLYTLGVGTAQGAALLNDETGWLQHDGKAVVTRLQAGQLQSLAQQGNGEYAEIADDDSEWRSLYDNGIARLQPVAREDEQAPQVIWQDLSVWFVLPGMLLLLLTYMHLPHRQGAASTLLLLVSLYLGGMLPSTPSQAADETYPAAYALYASGSYQAAAQSFARVQGYQARMGEGASLYQLQQYQQAAVVYIQAVLDADTEQQRAVALFNLGNSYFKQQAYTYAINSYRDVLRYHPAFNAARINLEYARALQQKTETGEPAVTNRAGSGPGMARPVQDLDLSKGRVGIDERASDTDVQLPLAVDTTPQQSVDKSLLERAQPATEKIERDADVQWTYDIKQAKDIQQADTRFMVDESILWQRLYETEEDYPAPRERPEILPGVAPW